MARELILALSLGLALAGCAVAPLPPGGDSPSATLSQVGEAKSVSACPPLPEGVKAEARRLTPIDPDMHRALILSEIEKNKALAGIAEAYERCRRG